MNQGRMMGLGAAFLLATLLLVGLLYRSAATGEVQAVPLPEVGPLKARPVPTTPTPPPMPRAVPKERPIPEGVATPEPVPVDVRQEYNYAMQDATDEAREQCVNPWLAESGAGLAPAVTFVMDAVVTDGELTDIALKGIGEIPDDVIECAREAAWAVDWPTWSGTGEMRFQKTFTASNPHGAE